MLCHLRLSYAFLSQNHADVSHVLFLACNKLVLLEGNHQKSVSANNAANSVADVLDTNISAVTKTDKDCVSARAAGKEFHEKLEQFCFTV